MKQSCTVSISLLLVLAAASASAKPIISTLVPPTSRPPAPVLTRPESYREKREPIELAAHKMDWRFRMSAPRERFDKRGRLLEWTPSEKQRIVELDKSAHPGLVVVAPPTIAYNCHALTFISSSSPDSRNTVIQHSEVPGILRKQGWEVATSGTCKPGDVVIYKDSRGRITHTGIVKTVMGGQVTQVRSKWGRYGEYIHHPRDVPRIYGKVAEIRTGGVLIGSYTRPPRQVAERNEQIDQDKRSVRASTDAGQRAVLAEATARRESSTKPGSPERQDADNDSAREHTLHEVSIAPGDDWYGLSNSSDAASGSFGTLLFEPSLKGSSILGLCTVLTLVGLGYLTSRRRTALQRS